MKTFNLFVGIDVSKKTLDIAIQTKAQAPVYFKVLNNASGLSQLLRKLETLESDFSKILVCCEHTGVFIEKLAQVMKGTEVTLWVVNPIVLKYATIDLNRYKTDKADAFKILDFAIMQQAKAVNYNFSSNFTYKLKQLNQTRKQLVRLRQQVSNFMSNNKEKVFGIELSSLILKHIYKELNEGVKQLEKEIKEEIKRDPVAAQIYKILLSIPGIGPVIAQHLILITDCFKRFSDYKSFACYVGIAPFPKQSGSSLKVKSRTSKKANQALKAELFQGALSVCREKLFFNKYYKSKEAEQKHHLWIMNSIMNMMVKIIFVLIKNNQAFCKETFLKSKISWQNA